MKKKTLRTHHQQLAALEQMHLIIQMLPDDFPAAVLQSPAFDGGWFIFNGDEKSVIGSHFGTDGWRKHHQSDNPDGTSAVEWVKLLPNGVFIKIWNCETVDDSQLIFGQLVDPSEFGTETTPV